MINGHLVNWVCASPLIYNGPVRELVGDGNNGSDGDEDNEELPSLEALEEHLRTPAHNRTIPSALDDNQTDNSAEGRRIGAVPQFRGD
jgi:hypothetical protein